jgi:mannitol/fructose-specific phosphotransferase system IIA component (Ntr-type)
MSLSQLVRRRLIFPGLPGTDAPSVLRSVSEKLVEAGLLDDAEKLYSQLWEREKLGSTGIGSGVAIPHCKYPGLERALLAVVITEQEIDFGAADDRPVQVFFVLVSPSNAPAAHLQALSAISRWLKIPGRTQALLDTEDPDEIHALLIQPEP